MNEDLRRKLEIAFARSENQAERELLDLRWYYYTLDTKERAKFKEAAQAFAKCADLFMNFHLHMKATYAFQQHDEHGNVHDFGSGSTSAEALLTAIPLWDEAEELEAVNG